MILILSLFCVSAQAGNVKAPFIPYVKRFIHEAESRKAWMDLDAAKNLTIQFGFEFESAQTMGQCNMKSHSIVISETYWQGATDLQKEHLIFHELGHCLLGRYHDDGKSITTQGTIPKSIMGSSSDAIMSRFCKEAFNKCFSNDGDFEKQMNACMKRKELSYSCYGTPYEYDPISKNAFYNKYHKSYLDELFRKAS